MLRSLKDESAVTAKHPVFKLIKLLKFKSREVESEARLPANPESLVLQGPNSFVGRLLSRTGTINS